MMSPVKWANAALRSRGHKRLIDRCNFDKLAERFVHVVDGCDKALFANGFLHTRRTISVDRRCFAIAKIDEDFLSHRSEVRLHAAAQLKPDNERYPRKHQQKANQHRRNQRAAARSFGDAGQIVQAFADIGQATTKVFHPLPDQRHLFNPLTELANAFAKRF